MAAPGSDLHRVIHQIPGVGLFSIGEMEKPVFFQHLVRQGPAAAPAPLTGRHMGQQPPVRFLPGQHFFQFFTLEFFCHVHHHLIRLRSFRASPGVRAWEWDSVR